MKFTKNRLLSLLLVLAMMLALVPTVFAANCEDGQHTLAWKESNGQHVQYCTKEGCTYVAESGHAPTYSGAYTATTVEGVTTHSRDCTGASGCTIKDSHTPDFTTTPLVYEKTAAGHQVVCHVSGCDIKNEVAAHNWRTNDIVCGDCGYVGVSVSVDELGTVAKTATVKATAHVTPVTGLTIPEGKDAVTWSSLNTDIATIDQSGNITIKKAGKATIKAALSASGLSGIADQKVLSIQPSKPAFATNGDLSSTTRQMKKTDTMQPFEVTVTDPTTVDTGATLTYEWYLNGTKVDSATSKSYTPAAPSSGFEAGKKYTVSCKIYAVVDGVKSEALTSTEASFMIMAPYRVVIKPYAYNPSSPKVGDTLYYTIKAEKYTNAPGTSGNSGYQDTDLTDNISLSISATSTNGTVSGNTSSIYGNYAVKLTGAAETGSTSFTVTATANSGTGVSATKVAENSLPGSFTYQTISSPVLMVPYSSSVAYMDMNTLSTAVYSATSGYTPSSIYFYAGSYGTFNGTSSSSATAYTNSSTTYFTAGSSYTGFTNPNMSISFTAYDSAYSSKKVLAKGTIKFSAASSIVYNATSSTPVYFKASDFTDYFTKAVGGSYSSSYYAPSLSYVTFGTPTLSNRSVSAGSFYNGSSAIIANTTKVYASELGYVSYTPSSSTYTYTVSIPFTAYGTYYYGSTATRTVSGTVTIKVNDGHVITMVGTDFKSASIWSDITSKHPGVSYVSFSQPQSTAGKLYYGYSSIASKGSLVSYTDRFNNSNYNYSYASTNKSIDGIYFVPAADCLDTVTLTYTAYTSATATTGVSDTITFTITKKTASSIFNDVTASNTGKWSADAIDFLARNSIVEGGSYGTFNPNGNMTRGDFVLMLYRLAGKPSVSGISNPFTDVKSSDYYYNAILWAYRNDIVTGVDAKTFAPKKNITREQIAATLYRMAGSPSTSGYLTGYYDYAKIHSYATNAMRWAISNGVITGSNGYLTPTNNATRAQVATMLHRYLTK